MMVTCFKGLGSPCPSGCRGQRSRREPPGEDDSNTLGRPDRARVFGCPPPPPDWDHSSHYDPAARMPESPWRFHVHTTLHSVGDRPGEESRRRCLGRRCMYEIPSFTDASPEGTPTWAFVPEKTNHAGGKSERVGIPTAQPVIVSSGQETSRHRSARFDGPWVRWNLKTPNVHLKRPPYGRSETPAPFPRRNGSFWKTSCPF